jgi:hypothetical protein
MYVVRYNEFRYSEVALRPGSVACINLSYQRSVGGGARAEPASIPSPCNEKSEKAAPLKRSPITVVLLSLRPLILAILAP